MHREVGRFRREFCLDNVDYFILESILRESIDVVESVISRYLGRGFDVYTSIAINIDDNCLSKVSVDVEVASRRRLSGKVDLDVVIDGAVSEAFREIEKRFRELSRYSRG